jgi:hypothetical protein
MAGLLLDRKTVLRWLRLAALFAICLPAPAWAQGGPPLLTDDPDTPGPGYWEINLSAYLEKRLHSYTIETPRVDANLGVGKRIQLKFEVPWVRGKEEGSIRTGAGNAVAGVKYRFIGQEGTMIAWSVYPQLELNTTHASVTKGLVEDGRRLLLPTELTLEIFHVEINGELGRRFVEHGENSWIFGVSTEGHVGRRLEMLAELHGERPTGGSTEWIVNVGARQKLTGQTILLLSAGRGLTGPADERPRLLLYTGLQLRLPGIYTPELAHRGTRY